MSNPSIHIKQRISIYAILVCFILYWSINFLLYFKSNKDKSSKAAWVYNEVFKQRWAFFVQPPVYNERLFVLLRNKNTVAPVDSIELLQDVITKKRGHAPFNSSYNILDYILFKQIMMIKERSNFNYNSKQKESSGTLLAVQTIKNYAALQFEQLHIDTVNKEWQVKIIRQEMIPFHERNNPNYTAKTALFFESNFQSFK